MVEPLQLCTMSRAVRNNIELLKALSRMKPKQRQAVLKAADKDLILSVCECALNLLKGNINVSASEKRKLGRFKNILRRLVKKGEGLKSKKKYLIQKGGGVFLPILLSAVLQAILNN